MAASSIYSQQNASLAILKRVKELDPSITTILGGHNVSGKMGVTVLRYFPSVDYVSFGEGDETIVQVCTNLLAHKNETMPYGIIGHGDNLPETIPYRMTKDMNSVAVPDYRDFFEEVQKEASGFYGDMPVYYMQTYENMVFLEGSRGCWWGAKHPCSFCGLNGLTNVYREKTPQKLYSEIREMTARYPGVSIQLSDNVLSQNMIREFLPMLAGDPESYSILAEIKTNLRSDHVKALFRAGLSSSPEEYMWLGCSGIRDDQKILDPIRDYTNLNGDSLLQFISESCSKEHLEDNGNKRRTDREAIQLICDCCNCSQVQEIGGWEKARMEAAIITCLKKGISIRQLSRLTAISKSKIEKLSKN